MNNQDYEQKKKKCWEEYLAFNDEEYSKSAFSYAFDRAYALGKQEKDVDETVIRGWVARDKRDNALLLHAGEPYRTWSGYQMDAKQDVWESDFASFLPLDSKLFPDLTWESDPIEVELIIKRKNNGNIQ
ncbi:MAG: hypothetical protein BHV69_09945 [Bacteroidales bacterium 52_46]|mgnify:CR=1 FL=1|nr:MAG: hypothetical protein BHV69_09945 [Bacteroidales bacterium 52_46]